MRLEPRTPTDRVFVPVGHLALQKMPDWDKKFGFPDVGVIWIMSLYVSWTLQNGGMGRSAVRQL